MQFLARNLFVFITGLATISFAWAEDPAVARYGMAVTAHSLASEAAVDVLKEGGNAVDAAIAAAFTLAVVEPWSSGIGGGGFMLFYNALEDTSQVLDFREHAPLKAHRNMFMRGGVYDPDLARKGWLAVGTPGTVAGLIMALNNYGTLSLERLLQPAIHAAREGFPVDEQYLKALNPRALDLLRQDQEASRIFLVPGENQKDGYRPPPLGSVLIQPDLAKTLRTIAKEGTTGFYEGPVADAIVRASNEGGGIISLNDLAAYAPVERAPFVFRFRDIIVHSMPLPSSGGISLASLLGMMERFDISREGFDDSRRLHMLAECMRIVFANRNKYLGDPAFISTPINKLVSSHYLNASFRKIDPLKASPSSALPDTSVESLAHEGDTTTHISIVDSAGNAVALTQTINYTFGAGVVAKGTGVLMNNEMDDFSTSPDQPNIYGLVQSELNAIAPRKIPLSSMSPTVVLRKEDEGSNRLYMVLGSPGGPTIISTVAQIIINAHVFGMNIAEAIAAPRIHHQWLPDRLVLEDSGFSAETIQILTRLGHETQSRRPWGNAQAILIDPSTGLITGSSDPRGGGLASGF